MKSMTARERFHALADRKAVDRMPVMEWAPWWHETVDRWKREGLPAELAGVELQRYFDLDVYAHIGTGYAPKAPKHGAGTIACAADYDAFLKQRKPPAGLVDRAAWAALAEGQRRGDTVVRLSIHGYFWHPRTLFGIERHMYAFYDDAELMHRMNNDHVEYSMAVLDEILKVCKPDFMTFAEDMSYNHGPMLSKKIFDEFLKPYYLRTVPRLKEAGIRVIVDSDGQVVDLVPWLEEVGVEGILPLERQAGCDIPALRRRHPALLMMGGYDKMVMHHGEAALRAEFERLLPAMRAGGYFLSCDHQTPPGVSLKDYRLYLRLFREYARKAVE